MTPEIDLYFADNPDGQPLTHHLAKGNAPVFLVAVVRQLSAGNHDFKFSILRMRTLDDDSGEGFVIGRLVPGPCRGPRVGRLEINVGDLTTGFVVAGLEVDGEPFSEVTLQVTRES